MRFLKTFLFALLGVFGLVGLGVTQTTLMPIPSGVCTAANQILAAVDSNNVRCTASPSIGTSLTIGSGTAITKVAVYSATVATPSIAANTCTETSVSVSGITSGDKLYVNPPAISGSASVVAARHSGSDTVALTFCNMAALSNQPRPGTYTITAIRS